MKELLTGNQIIVRAALDVKAEAFFGYPITPATEILEEWAKLATCNGEYKNKIISVQMEDEIAAGFALIGSVLAGKKAFTATSGPGNVIMQDAFSMAEAMRLPTVAFIMQRGGPSTGTVIYSQGETALTCFGGNGEGFRIVYSPSSLEELYLLSKKAFNSAWKYRFPTFVLSDGYHAKMRGNVDLEIIEKLDNYSSEPYLLSPEIYLENKMPKGSFLQSKSKSKSKQYTSLRNCYNMEEELNEANNSTQDEFERARKELEEWEIVNDGAENIIIAHGIVAAAAKQAIADSRHKNIGLFRPITLNPFPAKALRKFAENKKRITIIESSNGQMGRMAKEALFGLNIEIKENYRMGMGFYPEEIVKLLNC